MKENAGAGTPDGRAGARVTQVRGGITAATATGRSVGRPGESDRREDEARVGQYNSGEPLEKGRPPARFRARVQVDEHNRETTGRADAVGRTTKLPLTQHSRAGCSSFLRGGRKSRGEWRGSGAKKDEESSERAGGVGPSHCHGRRLPRCILSCRGRGAEAAAAAWVSIKLLEARYASPSLPLHRSLVSSTNDIRRQRRKRGAKEHREYIPG